MDGWMVWMMMMVFVFSRRRKGGSFMNFEGDSQGKIHGEVRTERTGCYNLGSQE